MSLGTDLTTSFNISWKILPVKIQSVSMKQSYVIHSEVVYAERLKNLISSTQVAHSASALFQLSRGTSAYVLLHRDLRSNNIRDIDDEVFSARYMPHLQHL